MSDRDLKAWEAFICDPGRAGRHLGGILGGPYERRQAVLSIADEPMRDFLTRITEKDAKLLSVALELADPLYGQMAAAIPALLLNLSQKRDGVRQVVGPGLWGDPQFLETRLGRRTGELPQGFFVSKVPIKHSATPENRVLNWVGRSLASDLDALARLVPLPPRLASVAKAMNDVRSHPAFLGHGAPAPSPSGIQRCGLQRQLGYRITAKVAEQRLRSLKGDATERRAQTLALLRSSWLSPTDPDDVFELFGLVLVLDVLEHDLGLGLPKCYAIGAPGRDYVAEFEQGWRVYFDRSPVAAFKATSTYKRIVDSHYGLKGGTHRPDIIVTNAAHGQARRTVAIEVKRSTDALYLTQSLQKAMVYLQDFKDIWPPESSLPNVILFVPEGRVAHDGNAMHEIVVVRADQRKVLASGMASGLGIA